jgi:AraC family transcriptional regulator
MEIAQPQVPPFGALGFSADAAPFHFTESQHAPDARIPMHRHGAPNLSVVIAGGFEETSGPHDHDCARGTLIVHPGDDAHRDRIGHQGAVCLNIFVREMPDHLGPIFALERLILSPPLRRQASHLHRKLREGIVDAVQIAEETLELLALLPREERTRKRPPKWLRDVADRLNEQPNTGPGLEELAETAQVHPVHLSRSFFAHYGMTLGEHRRRRRIEWTRDQLLDGNPSLAQLALDAGFCDQAHFTRAFRARFGVTPAQFRRTAKGS